jgi:peptidoglycan/LPS O-acetylase OafA/YrhL
MIAYWYIPFAGLLFIASPLYLKFIKLDNKKQIAIIVVGYIISGIVHRPEYNINHIQSLIYFSPAYMLGIWSSINKDLIYEKLKNKEIYLLAIIIILGYVQGVVLDHPEGYHKPLLEFKGIDITIYQKIFIIYFFMVFFHRFEGKRFIVLDFMARYSFAVFFIHGYILTAIMDFKEANNIEIHTGIIGLLLITFIITMVSAIIAHTIKKIIPNKSRMIIGA